MGNMMPDLITDHLDIWTAAETPKKAGGRGRGANTKKSPHGIKKLRELILELAVRGKLVPPACRQAGKTSDSLPLPQQGKWFVYVLECEDGSFYKGFTTDLPKRWKAHTAGYGAEYTRKHKPVQVYYWEEHLSEASALKRERYLKSGVGREWFKKEVVEKPDAWLPASELLKKIAAEKAKITCPSGRRVKACKIKKQKLLPPINEDEKPFTLPNDWEWTRLGDITNYGVSDKVEPCDMTEDLWVLELEDVEKETSKLLQKVRFSERQFRSSKNRFSMNDVIYGKLRPYLDKVIIADEVGVCTTEMIPVRGYCNIMPKYLRVVMKSPYFIKYANESTHGMSLPRMGTDKARLALFPMVNESEQRRIAAKVDELMALCDVLEQEQTDSSEAHQILVNAFLERVVKNASSNHSVHAELVEAFDTLFTTEQSIDQLKQTILQLAVMGKLVPQDPNDEPASELLKKIAAEKTKLIKEKKIKKQKPLQRVSEEEMPFDLPRSWLWVRLGEITSKITDGDHKTPPRIAKGYRLLSAKNVRDGFLDFDNCDFIAEEDYLKSRERCCSESNDLLIVSVGGTIGRTSLVPNDSKFALVRSVALIKPLFINSWYLKYAMDSVLLQDSIHARKRGGAQPCLYLSEIVQFHFSLPPLAEQHRIVAKVDELMTLCDNLKKHLNEAQTTQVQLADAIVEQVGI